LPATLSTGEQQRVGIARAIVARPSLLIADEPTGNLDPQLAVEIMTLFSEFQLLGTTVLIASHDLPLIKRMKKRVIVLDHGRLVADLAAEEVLWASRWIPCAYPPMPRNAMAAARAAAWPAGTNTTAGA